jgi:signal transduction histidine kinase
MTAALAHEVQNPVAAIRMHAQLWRQEHGDEPAATIEAEAARIESLLNQWMFLTRSEAPVLAPLDVGALLQQLVRSQRPQTEHAAVRVELQLADDLTTAADKKRLEQVFRNLLNNAVQAMPSGGLLVIRGEREPERLRITFADHGVGFSAKALAHFAEFFYSEKEGGMGIGLSVAQEILRAHGGSLRGQNRAGGGASVTAELPVRGPSPA